MTERLYYTDPALLDFKAQILRTESVDGKFLTILDRTAFYPTSGGQLHDTGTLNGVAVIDVVELENGSTDHGEIGHLSLKSIGSPGAEVQGAVDSERRWKNRQMHTAQHILSQAFVRLCQAETVSVHLGEEYGAVELDAKEIAPAQLHAVEQLAAEIIRDNLPVEIIMAEGEEIRQYPLRKIPERPGRLRIIKTGEFDFSACGGTHCNSAAEVGLLKIIAVEKQRGNLLVRFLSGTQALTDYNRRFEITDNLARSFTCSVDDLNMKIIALATEHKSMRKEITDLRRQLLPVRVDKLAATARMLGRLPVVSSDVSDLDASDVNPLATMLADRIAGVALLAAKGRLVVATAPTSDIHAGNLVKQFCRQSGFKGGGSEPMAQVGGAEASDLPQLLKILEELIADD